MDRKSAKNRLSIVFGLAALSTAGVVHTAAAQTPEVAKDHAERHPHTGETSASPAAHPLDALTAAEIDQTVRLLKAAKRMRPDAKTASVSLLEPEKQEVLAWKNGMPFSRSAVAIILQDRKTYKAKVDLKSSKIRSWEQVKDGHASFLLAEVVGSAEIVVKDPLWQEAMRKRGITDFSHIMCNPLSVGYVADESERSRRLMNVPCFDTHGQGNNAFGRPIEGLMAVVDLDDRKVVRLVDLGPVPLPPAMPKYDYASQQPYRHPMKPVELASPAGHNYVVNGGEVKWDNWSFHLRLDRRSGPVLSLVKWDDKGRERSVAYQIAASEMFVPYMDPTPTWSFKSYLDAGEYGLGLLAFPLDRGRDCPADALYLDGVLPDDNGKPTTVPRAICIFERNAGDPAWRHVDTDTRGAESRPEVDLVVRSIPVIGNYDYILDYVFTQKGEVVVRVGATGIDAVKGVAAHSLKDPSAAQDTQYGTLIGPGVVGVNHDHYVNFRLDMDVDGPANSFMVDHIVPKEAPPSSPRRTYWQVESEEQQTEGAVESHGHDAQYRMANPNSANAYGYHPGYVLMSGHNASSLLSEDDPIQGRALFAKKPVWITRYAPSEMFGAGEFANQSLPGEGLPKYTGDKASAVNTDLVLWYTVGFRHVTRAEDWPIMPTLWHEFRLRPFNFFDRNPALDLSPDFAK